MITRGAAIKVFFLSKIFMPLSGWLKSNRYSSGFRSWDSSVGKCAVFLYLSDILFMTRFYALSNLVETILFGLFLFSPVLRREFVKSVHDPLVACLMMFFLWALASGLWSSAQIFDILDDWWGWRKLLLLPIGLVLLNDVRVLKAGVIVFLSVGLMFFAIATTTWAWGFGEVWERPYTHMLQNHNAQGVYFAILGTAFLLCAKVVKQRGQSTLLLLVGLGLLMFTAWVGSSRSGYVSFLIGLSIAFFFWSNSRWYGIVIGVVLAGSVLVFSPTANQRVNQAVSEIVMGAQPDQGYASSGSIRIVMWQNTLEIIKDHWLIGTGADGFKAAYLDEVAGVTGWRSTPTDDPHNHFLHILAEYGVVGLGLFFCFELMLLLRADINTMWGLTLLAILLISNAVGMFNGVFGSSIEGRIIQFSFALCLAAQVHFPNRRHRLTGAD